MQATFVHAVPQKGAHLRVNKAARRAQVAVAAGPKVMIAGAPGCGKGTQCAKIVEKYGLVHISVGDLLREEVKQGTPAGLKAKSFMESGNLVPDSVVVEMVKTRLDQDDVKSAGWLLDGYPRSASQAEAIEQVGIRPDQFLLINVPSKIIVDRVVGRRLDPETGDIYHLTFKPPPAEIVDRLVHMLIRAQSQHEEKVKYINDAAAHAVWVKRADDTEEKANTRIQVYTDNVNAVNAYYKDQIVNIDGNVPFNDVFTQIDASLQKLA